MGNTQEQVDELMAYLSTKGLSQYDNATEANAGIWPKGNPNNAYAKYFIGNSYLATITPKNMNSKEKTILPLSNVTFEPGCRNNWHIDRKSTRLNSSHANISYAVFCLKKKKDLLLSISSPGIRAFLKLHLVKHI